MFFSFWQKLLSHTADVQKRKFDINFQLKGHLLSAPLFFSLTLSVSDRESNQDRVLGVKEAIRLLFSIVKVIL